MDRFKHVDILKGIGILSVIFFHIFTYNKTALYYSATFTMPIFFFLSGYLFKISNFESFVLRKVKGLLIPYCVFGMLNLILCFYFHKITTLGEYLTRFLWINNHTTLFIAGALWFLTSLFFTNIFAYLILKNKKHTISIFYFLFFIALTYLYIFRTKLPFAMDTAIFMLPIFFIGYFFKKIEKSITPTKHLLLFAILFFMSLTSLPINGQVNPRICLFNNLLLYYIFSLIGTFAFYNLSHYISKYKNSEILVHFGKNSLYYLCFSEMITYSLKWGMKLENNLLLYFVTLLLIYALIIIMKLTRKVKNG